MKTLLVSPYKKSLFGLAKFPPIGLGYLATSLINKGYNVEILDCLKEGVDSIKYKNYIIRNKPDVVGINAWSNTVKEVKEIIDITKQIDKNIVVVVGGPHPSAVPVEAMEYFNNADYGFKGEAEIGLPMLMEKLRNKENVNIGEIPGLIWKDNGKIIVNEQIYYGNLDAFDYIAWDIIKPEEYSQPGTITYGRTAPIVTTRGCPYLCTFCSPHIIAGRKIRYRSADNVVCEIRLLRDRHGIKRIAIMDENFTFNKQHAMSVLRKIRDEKFGMQFSLPNGIRLDSLDSELLSLMRDANVIPNIAVGIESGSERILKMIKKNLKKETIREKIKLMNSHGFRPIGYFILGFPTETVAEMYETLRFAKELKLYRAAFSPLSILPGTEIYNELKRNGELPIDYNFSSLSTDNIIYAPAGISRGQFSKLRKNIILKFNLQPRVIYDYIRDLNSFVFAISKFTGIFLKRKNYAACECNNN